METFSSEAIDSLIIKQRQYFRTGITRDVSFRVFQLKLLKKIIMDSESALIEALGKDLGKSPFEAYATEIGLVYEEIDNFIKQLPKWSRPEKVKTSMVHFPSESEIHRVPKGVCLIISPWNYPVNLLMMPLVGAIGAGNCCIVKPSALTPNVNGIVEKMIKDHFKEDYLTIVTGDSGLGELLTAAAFDHIFFTGSVSAGKSVMRSAANRMTSVTLELGGKSPCIVDCTANLEVAAKRIVWGKLMNAGQTCVAPDYLMVHADIKDRLIHLMVEAALQFYGPDFRMSKDYPRIIDKRNVERLAMLMDGCRVIYGGEWDRDARYFAPTLLDEIPCDHPILQEEIFGPLLPILTYEAVDEVISYIEKQPNPLALYVFSEEEALQNQLIQSLSFGGGCINDTVSHVSNGALPFGGVGASGIGSYHGYKSFLAFSHEKGILKKGTKVDMALKYPPYNMVKFKALKQLIK